MRVGFRILTSSMLIVGVDASKGSLKSAGGVSMSTSTGGELLYDV